MRDLILLAAVSYCAVNALRRPTFGLLAFVFFSTLNPHSMTWGFARSLPFAQMIAIPTLIGTLLSGQRQRLPMAAETKVLLALWFLFAITTIFARHPDLAGERLVYVSKILLMVFLTMYLIDSKASLRHLFLVICLTLGFHGLKGGAFFVLSGGSQMVWGPEESFLYANNSIGLALAMNVPFLWYLSAIEENRWLRRLMRLMLLFSLPAVIGTFSRGAWVAMGVATMYIVFHSRRRVLLTVLAVIVALIMLPLLSERVTDRFQDLVNADQEASAQSRIHNWKYATNVALDRPLTGGGFAHYSIEMWEQYYPQLLVLFPHRYEIGAWSSHSIWFTILGEHGFVGLFLFALLFFICLRSLKRSQRHAETSEEMAWMEHYALMLRGGLLAYLVAGTFLDAAYFDLLYYFIAATVIMKRLIHEQQLAAVESKSPNARVRQTRTVAGWRASGRGPHRRLSGSPR